MCYKLQLQLHIKQLLQEHIQPKMKPERYLLTLMLMEGQVKFCSLLNICAAKQHCSILLNNGRRWGLVLNVKFKKKKKT